MATRIVLHIGPRKTGSTFLQQTLTALAPVLLEHDVLYPTRMAGADRYNHVAAVFSVEEARAGRRGAWSGTSPAPLADLVRQIDAFSGVVVLSAEAAGGLQSSAARALLTRLPGVPVHAIACLRALPAIFISSWTQHVANGHRISLERYVKMRIHQREASPPPDHEARWDEGHDYTFWRSYYYPGLVRRWASLVDSFSVITVPPSTSDKGVLWSRFRDALESDAVPNVLPALPDHAGNSQMTMAEVEVLRAINREAAEAKLARKRIKLGTRDLSRNAWMAREDRGPRVILPETHLELVSSWGRQDASELSQMHVNVIGDLDDLLEVPDSQYPKPRASDVASAAGAAVAWAVIQGPFDPAWRQRVQRRISRWRRRISRWRRRISRWGRG